MVGFKHIPQTISGKKAEDILKSLPKKDCPHKDKGIVPLPDKFSIKQ